MFDPQVFCSGCLCWFSLVRVYPRTDKLRFCLTSFHSIDHNKSDVFDLAKKGRSLYQRIRLSDVAGLASNPNLVEQMTSDLGYQPGVDELIDESNRRLVETMVDAEDYLERRIGNDLEFVLCRRRTPGLI